MDKADRIIKINEALNDISINEGFFDWAGEKIAGLFGADASALAQKKSPEEIKKEIDRQRSMTPEQRRAEQNAELGRLDRVDANLAKAETAAKTAQTVNNIAMQIAAPGVGTAIAAAGSGLEAAGQNAVGNVEGRNAALKDAAFTVALGGAGKVVGMGAKAVGIGKATQTTGNITAATTAAAKTAGTLARTGQVGAQATGAAAKTAQAGGKMLELAPQTLKQKVTSAVLGGPKITDYAGRPIGAGRVNPGIVRSIGSGIANFGKGLLFGGGGAGKAAKIGRGLGWFSMLSGAVGGGGGGSGQSGLSSQGQDPRTKIGSSVASAVSSQDYGSGPTTNQEREDDLDAYMTRLAMMRR
jgi:hypothetical protein